MRILLLTENRGWTLADVDSLELVDFLDFWDDHLAIEAERTKQTRKETEKLKKGKK